MVCGRAAAGSPLEAAIAELRAENGRLKRRQRVHTTAKVHTEPVEGGFGITRIDLETEAVVPGIDNAKFQEQAEAPH